MCRAAKWVMNFCIDERKTGVEVIGRVRADGWCLTTIQPIFSRVNF